MTEDTLPEARGAGIFRKQDIGGLEHGLGIPVEAQPLLGDNVNVADSKC